MSISIPALFQPDNTGTIYRTRQFIFCEKLPMRTANSNTRLVYSDENGSTCDHCNKSLQKCQCNNNRPKGINSDGIVRIMRSTKGRKGKGVTVITGIPLAPAELKTLAKTLKQKCGSGGTVKEGTVEIQGDHREQLFLLLQEKGWIVKKAGG